MSDLAVNNTDKENDDNIIRFLFERPSVNDIVKNIIIRGMRHRCHMSTDQNVIDYLKTVEEHTYRFYSVDFLYNLGIMSTLDNELKVKHQTVLKNQELLIEMYSILKYILEEKYQCLIELPALDGKINAFCSIKDVLHTKNYHVKDWNLPEYTPDIETINSKSAGWNHFFKMNKLFDSNNLYDNIPETMRMLNDVFNQYCEKLDFIFQRNINEKNGMVIPISFYIHPIFLTLTFIY